MELAKTTQKGNGGLLTPRAFQDRFSHMVDDFFKSPWDFEMAPISADWFPAVDIKETNSEYNLAFEVPGMTKEDIKISVENNLLSISGEKRTEERKDTDKVHRLERSYGSFQRSFTLPRPVQGDKVAASLKDGILKVTVPKAEEAKAKAVDIKVN